MGRRTGGVSKLVLLPFYPVLEGLGIAAGDLDLLLDGFGTHIGHALRCVEAEGRRGGVVAKEDRGRDPGASQLALEPSTQAAAGGVQRQKERQRRASGEQLLALRGGADCGWRRVWRVSAAAVVLLGTRLRLRGRPGELGKLAEKRRAGWRPEGSAIEIEHHKTLTGGHDTHDGQQAGRQADKDDGLATGSGGLFFFFSRSTGERGA